MHGPSFLGQTTIQTRQILFGFYPSVQITIMSHDENYQFAWKVNSDQNISLEVIENLARTMWLRMSEVIFSICHIWPHDVIDDVAR
jgi:hypothetical protein